MKKIEEVLLVMRPNEENVVKTSNNRLQNIHTDRKFVFVGWRLQQVIARLNKLQNAQTENHEH